MKKIKKTFTYLFGAFIAFLFSKSTTLAQEMPVSIKPMYGIDTPIGYAPIEIQEPTLWEKVLSVILSPIVIVIIVVLAIVIGTVIFIKRSRKNAQRNS